MPGQILCASSGTPHVFTATVGLPLRTLSRTGHGRPQLFRTGLTRAERHAEVADERLRTGVNETKTETTRRAHVGHAEQPSGTTWSSCRGRRVAESTEAAPTRFPTRLTGVHRWPPPSVTCSNLLMPAAGERCRTGVMRLEMRLGWRRRAGREAARARRPGDPPRHRHPGALHRPPPLLPPGTNPASCTPSAVLANRADSISILVTGSSIAAVLLALCGSTAIITALLTSSSSQVTRHDQARRATQLPAGKTSLEPQPRRESGRAAGAAREPERQRRRRPIRERARPAPGDPRPLRLPETIETSCRFGIRGSRADDAGRGCAGYLFGVWPAAGQAPRVCLVSPHFRLAHGSAAHDVSLSLGCHTVWLTGIWRTSDRRAIAAAIGLRRGARRLLEPAG
jgi:hypothetical protein